MATAEELILRLGLQPLVPEGGYFARTWTSHSLTEEGRVAGTAIYFLLTAETFSAFHRLNADELWHYYAGDPIEHWQIGERTALVRSLIGPDLVNGEYYQLTVPSKTWQAARLDPLRKIHGWSLVGCTMCPGWDDRDFELLTPARFAEMGHSDVNSLAALVRR